MEENKASILDKIEKIKQLAIAVHKLNDESETCLDHKIAQRI
jgi:hypothetical protein